MALRDAVPDAKKLWLRQATEIAVPLVGYKNRVGIDRAHGFIRKSAVTHAAAHDGGQLTALLDRDNLVSGVLGRYRLPLAGYPILVGNGTIRRCARLP